MTVLAAVALAAFVYARGARTLRQHPPYRSALFFLGLLAILIALVPPLDAAAHELFYAHMAQHMLLTVVAAPLLLLGHPVRPLGRGVPRAMRRAVVAPIARARAVRGVLNGLRHPLVAAAVYVSGLYLWHFPPFYDAAVADAAIHQIEHSYFLASALLFWSNVVDPEPFRARLPYPFRILYLLLSGAAQNTILGGLLSFSSRVLYGSYQETAPARGVDPLTDQQAGGAMMWVPGDVIFLAAASVCFFLFLEREERQQLERERSSRESHSPQGGPRRTGG
ncbi:MAG: cytochrome c oxidase assembly protein [Chloroflexi bacterium]|nr:cytochrome c oxidase assembly protein [Chloroflexota bacterium]